MDRYQGQELPSNPKIAVIANDAIGNFVMATPLLQMLRDELKPSELHLYCGTRASEFYPDSKLADEFINLHGANPDAWIAMMQQRRGHYDLVVNCEASGLSKTTAWILGEEGCIAGPSLGDGGRGELDYQNDDRGRLWSDPNWISNDIVLRYPFLKSPFISEIFARLCYLKGELAPYQVPKVDVDKDVPDIVISGAASIPEKLWPVDRWIEVTHRLGRSGHSIGLVGAKPSDQAKYWKGGLDEEKLLEFGLIADLRGHYSLPEVVGVLAKAKVVLTIDNGILHLAVAAGTPTVGLYRFGIHRLWAPPFDQLTVITPGEGNPVSVISVERVVDAVEKALG